jgi:hypothetical protein
MGTAAGTWRFDALAYSRARQPSFPGMQFSSMLVANAAPASAACSTAASRPPPNP